MNTRTVIPIAAISGLVALGTIIAVGGKAEAAPPEVPFAEIPMKEDILQAKNFLELNIWYNLIGQLFIMGKLSRAGYLDLYDTYRERWYQLIGDTT